MTVFGKHQFTIGCLRKVSHRAPLPARAFVYQTHLDSMLRSKTQTFLHLQSVLFKLVGAPALMRGKERFSPP
jgi:hypothetical protein